MYAGHDYESVVELFNFIMYSKFRKVLMRYWAFVIITIILIIIININWYVPV